MGFYEGLNEEQYDRQYPDRELAHRIIAYFTVQRKAGCLSSPADPPDGSHLRRGAGRGQQRP